MGSANAGHGMPGVAGFQQSRPLMSPLARHDIGAIIVAPRGVAFNGKDIEARRRYLLAQFRRREDARIGRLADQAHRGQCQPDERVHVAHARRLEMNKPPGSSKVWIERSVSDRSRTRWR